MPTFDWVSIYPYLVAAGNLLGFYVKSRPETGWFKNIFIPRWTFTLGFIASLLLGLQKFGEAAGLSQANADHAVVLAGWSWTSLWPVVKLLIDSLIGGGATMAGSHLTYEKGNLRGIMNIQTPKAARR